MIRPLCRTPIAVSVVSLGWALLLGSPPPVEAQTGTEGPGLSSGSGQGTGTGASSGIQRNQSGSVSGVGPGSATGGLGPESGGLTPITGNRAGTGTNPLPGDGGSIPLQPRGPATNMGIPFGPGVNTTFPDDASLFPFTQMPSALGGNANESSAVQDSQIEHARRIRTAGDRSMALQRVANAAIFSNQLSLAHTALGEAAQAAVEEPARLVHDQRLIAIITTYMNLGEAHLREGKADLSLPDPSGGDAASSPKSDRLLLIRRASAEWQRAAALAGKILNPTNRSEMLYRVIDAMAFGSQTIVNEFPTRASGGNQGAGTDSARSEESFMGPAEGVLRDAATLAMRIERPVWRDRALVQVASAAASSRQFAQGLAVARMIPQPEVRTDALLRIAESQARRDDPQGATRTYREAARAVASIPLSDPRAVLAGVLIDNLISVGRFEDARASITLYPDVPRQVIALGSIAESQGRRGAAESARAWIERDVPAEYQAQLLRRVNNGVLTSIEQNRSRDLSNRDR
jgi:hypothetical protein